MVHAVMTEDIQWEETPRDELFKRYDVLYTPTVGIFTSDGEEIDRVVGYDPPADEYPARVEAAYQGDNTLKALRQKHAENPDDVELMVNLTNRYLKSYVMGAMVDMGRQVLDHKDAARKFAVQVKDDVSANGYEFARAVEVYGDPTKGAAFFQDFPETQLKPLVLRFMRWRLYDDKDKELAQIAYHQLLDKFPSDPTIMKPYMVYAARTGNDIDKGLEIGADLEKNYPDELKGYLNSYATLLLKKGKDKKAIKIYGDNVVKKLIADEDADGLNGYAWFWAQKGKNLDSAHKAALKSLEFKDEANTWDTLSMVLWKQGKLDEALEAEEKALAMVGGEHKSFEERIAKIKADME